MCRLCSHSPVVGGVCLATPGIRVKSGLTSAVIADDVACPASCLPGDAERGGGGRGEDGGRYGGGERRDGCGNDGNSDLGHGLHHSRSDMPIGKEFTGIEMRH